MCGIAGIFNSNDATGECVALLNDMLACMTHRGPDSSGSFASDGVALGARRLSIVDRKMGDQPHFNEDKSIVSVCNGEIFNYPELRADLIRRGHRFRSETDVEIIPHLYEDMGIEFVNLLNGQFAFALYDSNKRKLWLARDQFGICPLYYTMLGKTMIFASEIKAILQHAAVSRRVNLRALDQIIVFPGVISPETMFADVR